MSWILSSGDVVAHFRVLSPLGAGGMGQVYLAEDSRLHRRIALKVLDARSRHDDDRLARFEREARAVSALNHPNILTIHDIGETNGIVFIATEYVDGVTLRARLAHGPLELGAAIDITIQVATALAAAHETGIIHRDLKPENVMIRSDGYVKVLDFGLAKLLPGPASAVTSGAPTRLAETRDGAMVGTFTYMAPEQARGLEIDARADLFALGVLLYEMLTGVPPFPGATAADTIGALLLRDPEPIAKTVPVPPAVERIVERALRKRPEERYPTCAELLQDLRSLARAASPSTGPGAANLTTKARRPGSASPANGNAFPAARSPRAVRRRSTARSLASLAVLPFANRGADEELDYLCEGLTENLINNLSQLPRLRVMARSTVFRYQQQSADPAMVGRDLGVQAVLTGRVVQRGGTLAVAAELVDVQDGSQLWGAMLNRPTSDVVVLQDEIAQEIVGALRLRLTRAEKKRLVKQHTASAAAYQLYLRGRYFLNNRTGEALRLARPLFERAVLEDPGYALAHAGLADCCSLIAVSLRAASGVGLIEQARRAALRAQELDDGLAEGHASLAFVRFRFDWQWAAAETEFVRALELNPGHAPSRQWYAMFLASRSRFDAALGEMHRALELDPLSLIIQTGIGRILHFAGRYDEAITQYEHVLQANSGFAQTRIDLALTRMARGELDAARAELDIARTLLGPLSTILLLRTCCAAREGRDEDARALLAELRQRHGRGEAGADDLAMAAAACGDWPAARESLRQACEQRAPFLGYVDVEPAMAPLLQDAECRALLRSHGFDAGGSIG